MRKGFMPKKSRTWKGGLILALVLIAIGSGVYGYVRRQRNAPKILPEGLTTATVRRLDLHFKLRTNGRIESAKRTLIECELENVAFANEGRSISAGSPTILEVVAEGSQVHRDDVLCRLDSSEYEELVRLQEIKVQQAINDHEKAELDVKAAEISLAEYRDGTLPQVLQSIEGEVVMAQSNIKRQTDRVAWADEMLRNGYFATGQIRNEKDLMLRSQVTLDRALGEREVLRKFKAPIAIHRLETVIAQAKSLLSFQDLRLNRNKSLLEKFRVQVAACTVRAPHDGLVIYANEGGAPRVEVGARVYQKMNLFFLPDLSNMEVETVLNESIVSKVQNNQPTRVRIESLPGLSIEGHVTSIAPLPFFRRDLPWGTDVRSYLSKVRLHTSPRGLLPGMSAEVEIETGQKSGALVVPSEAVVVERGHDYCYVSSKEGLERREIQVGEGTRDLIEVRSGLGEGEEVVLDPSKIDSGVLELATTHSRDRDPVSAPSDVK